jgi:hypothetical protein
MIGAMTTAPLAVAKDLTQRQEYAKRRFDEEIPPFKKNLESECGIKIVLTADFHDVGKAWEGKAPYGGCKSILQSLMLYCGFNNEQKQALAKRLKAVACRWTDKSGDNEYSFDLKTGTFSALIHSSLFDSQEGVKKYLTKLLEDL